MRTRVIRIIAAGSVLSLFAISQIDAQSVHYWKPALWVTKAATGSPSPTDTLAKVDSTSGAILLEIAAPDVSNIAIDEGRGGSIWALSPGVSSTLLRQYTFDGVLLQTVTLPVPSLLPGYGLAENPDCYDPSTDLLEELCAPHRDLVVNPLDGNLWVVANLDLVRVTPSGSYEIIETLSATAQPLRLFRAISLDATIQRFYTVHGGRVGRHRTTTGALQYTLPIPAGEIAQDVSVDRGSGDLWVAYSGSLKRFNSDSDEEVSLVIEDLRHVSADGVGEAYASTIGHVFHVDVNGNVDWDHGSLPLPEIVDLVSDPVDQSIWFATRFSVEQSPKTKSP